MASRYTDKTEITAAERLQLLGLLTIAQRHNLALQDIRKAAEAITGEKEEGHTGDAIYDTAQPNVDELLNRLGIKVSE